MTYIGREYVSRRRFTSEVEGYALCRDLAERLGPMERDGRLRGFLARALYTQDDIEDEDLDAEHILGATGGLLPALWLTLSFAAGAEPPPPLRSIEQEFDLCLLQEFPA